MLNSQKMMCHGLVSCNCNFEPQSSSAFFFTSSCFCFLHGLTSWCCTPGLFLVFFFCPKTKEFVSPRQFFAFKILYSNWSATPDWVPRNCQKPRFYLAENALIITICREKIGWSLTTANSYRKWRAIIFPLCRKRVQNKRVNWTGEIQLS